MLRYVSHVARLHVLGARVWAIKPCLSSKFQCKLFTTTAMRTLRDNLLIIFASETNVSLPPADRRAWRPWRTMTKQHQKNTKNSHLFASRMYLQPCMVLVWLVAMKSHWLEAWQTWQPSWVKRWRLGKAEWRGWAAGLGAGAGGWAAGAGFSHHNHNYPS